jgi:hypothetical protein
MSKPANEIHCYFGTDDDGEPCWRVAAVDAAGTEGEVHTMYAEEGSNEAWAAARRIAARFGIGAVRFDREGNAVNHA